MEAAFTQHAFCTYPPQLVADVEICPRNDSVVGTFIIGSAEAGRYLTVGELEHCVIQLLDGSRPALEVCSEMHGRHDVSLQLAVLTRFLGKLDQVGILAGRKDAGPQALLGNRSYLRWVFFNPDRMFARLLPALNWIWTKQFLAASLLFMAIAGSLALTSWAEVSEYSAQLLREHYLAVMATAWIVIMSHEFAHGMTSKAFGGRATEIGALLIYCCLPALYCNVSGLHLISKRGHRLWVIAAGIYWQVLVGAAAFLSWFLLARHTWLADLALIVAMASLFDVGFNANPLIKLDGYYFLSQWLGLPNLMDQSRTYWRALISGRAGQRQLEVPLTGRQKRTFALFGLLSFSYNAVFRLAIFWYLANYLTDRFQLAGLLLSLLLGSMYIGPSLYRRLRHTGMNIIKKEAVINAYSVGCE